MTKNANSDDTYFGYQTVSFQEKVSKVDQVFSSVASKYDIMNDLMSFGIHRIWKKIAIDSCNLQPGHKVLDLACGSGDLSVAIAKKIGNQGYLVAADLNQEMLSLAEDKLLDNAIVGNVSKVRLNAQSLPFADNVFDKVTIAFGLRNVAKKELALQEISRVLKPAGMAMVLEFSKTKSDLFSKIYDLYSFHVLPFMGTLVANDSDSYRYLAESIRMHPDQEHLKQMMLDNGFDKVSYKNLQSGIVAIHQGYKY